MQKGEEKEKEVDRELWREYRRELGSFSILASRMVCARFVYLWINVEREANGYDGKRESPSG